MKHKLTQKLDIEDSGLVDIINERYKKNSKLEGKKVIIDDQIGSIQRN